MKPEYSVITYRVDKCQIQPHNQASRLYIILCIFCTPDLCLRAIAWYLIILMMIKKYEFNPLPSRCISVKFFPTIRHAGTESFAHQNMILSDHYEWGIDSFIEGDRYHRILFHRFFSNLWKQLFLGSINKRLNLRLGLVLVNKNYPLLHSGEKWLPSSTFGKWWFNLLNHFLFT